MKTLALNNLGRALQLARSAAGVSQEDFVEVSGRTYISQLERCERHATLEKVDALAPVLGIHPATLVSLSYLTERFDANSVDALLDQIRSELTLISATFGKKNAKKV